MKKVPKIVKGVSTKIRGKLSNKSFTWWLCRVIQNHFSCNATPNFTGRCRWCVLCRKQGRHRGCCWSWTVSVCLIFLPRKYSDIKCCYLELSQQQSNCCLVLSWQQVSCCRVFSRQQINSTCCRESTRQQLDCCRESSR